MKKVLFILLFTTSVFAQTDEIIVSGNSKLHYRTFGSGKPILIINGGPGMNSDGFVDLAQKLSTGNQTIIYDQRGTGKSTLETIDTSTITMDLLVADMENLRKHLKINKWVVLGHSFGGMLASYYATKYPGHIDKLILSSSGGINLALRNGVGNRIMQKLTPAQKDSLNYWNRKIDAGDNSYNARIGRGRALAPAYVYDKKNVPIIAERLTQSNWQINELVWDDMQKIKFNCSSGLKNFSPPVLILQGKNDILETTIAETSHKAFKNATLILLDKCGHYGWLDKPNDYFTAINNFLNH